VKRVYGPVAQMDVDSARQRRLESAGVTLLPGRVPILALPLRKDGRRRVDPPGSYPCALEVHAGAGDVDDRGRVRVFHSFVPVAVTLLLGGGPGEFAVEDLAVEET
jgi:hypothetical protein